MRKHLVAGAAVGTLVGAFAAWTAMSSALHAGGLVALAGFLDGMMAGLGIGWLIGINVAEGIANEAEETFKPSVQHTSAIMAR
jgi:hypothetical protein